VLRAGGVAVAAFGVPGLLVRVLAAPTLPWLAAYAVLSVGCYVLLLRRYREELQLHDLRDLIRRPR
jgi:hypothetical protein